jgi:hypothetical protein
MRAFLTALKVKLQTLLAYEPAVVTWFVNGGVAAVVAFAIPGLPGVAVAAVTTITTAAASAYVAFKARPVAVSVATGALATILTATAGFGLHLDPHLIGTVVEVSGAVLGLLFRANLKPAIKLAAKPVAAG